MSAVFDLKAKLEEMGLAPKKALGQNFLINQYVIKKIIEAVRQQKFEDLIEVGPGLGALTDPLLANGLKPRVIELDPELVAIAVERRDLARQRPALPLAEELAQRVIETIAIAPPNSPQWNSSRVRPWVENSHHKVLVTG